MYTYICFYNYIHDAILVHIIQTVHIIHINNKKRKNHRGASVARAGTHTSALDLQSGAKRIELN